MKPIEMLMREHRCIEKGLDALDAFVEKAGREESRDEKGELSRFVEFIRRYADHAHHGKEEDILFDEMANGGFSRDGGPLAVMLAEHDEGRRQVAVLKALAEAPGTWSGEDRKRLLVAASSYTALLRQHIAKEDQVLYPMAQGNLGADAWNRIERRFSGFEAEAGNRAEKSRLEKLAADLGGRWGTSCRGKPTGSSSCGCCG
jgi:hemerythrin-like domain-containing protein